MSANDASRIIIDNSRVTLQIVASLADDSRGVIYNCNNVYGKGHSSALWCIFRGTVKLTECENSIQIWISKTDVQMRLYFCCRDNSLLTPKRRSTALWLFAKFSCKTTWNRHKEELFGRKKSKFQSYDYSHKGVSYYKRHFIDILFWF